MVFFGNKALAFLAALAMTGSFLASTADAHGYVTISRSKKCADGVNTNCGEVIYNAHILEGPGGYPGAGPPDGQLGSAGIALMAPLNQQSTTRWNKTTARTGSNNFIWQFTVAHRTRDWQYFITKSGWNQNAPLTRASFDSTPFCTVSGNNAIPSMQVTHTCNIPSNRSGYHVVLAVWNIGDTPNAFYNMIDFQLGTSTPTAPVASPPTVAPAPTSGGLADWALCTSSSQCNNGCCSGTYSNGVLKCTPLNGGFNSNICVTGTGPVPAPTPAPAPTSSSGQLGDWALCSSNSACRNGCCSSQYSGGVFKCTPLTGGFNANICTGGSGGSETPTCGGGNVGNGKCAGGLCCSQYGWCGCTPDHCTNGQVCSRRLRGGDVDEEPAAGPDGGEANVVA